MPLLYSGIAFAEITCEMRESRVLPIVGLVLTGRAIPRHLKQFVLGLQRDRPFTEVAHPVLLPPSLHQHHVDFAIVVARGVDADPWGPGLGDIGFYKIDQSGEAAYVRE